MVSKGKQQSSARKPRPKGPARPAKRRQSPAVYRRRRLFVGIVLVIVLAMLTGGFAAVSGLLASGTEQVSSRNADGGSGSGDAGKAEEAGTAGSPNSQPDSGAQSATPSATTGCDLSQVTVSASTDKPSYAEGENPMLTMKVTNGGQVPCEVNLGTSQMEFLVMSGSDRIFSSRDCQASSEDLVKIIEPGKSETANFPWQRNRSVEGCKEMAAKPGGGGATYIFRARLGNKESSKAVFQLG
ncbi:hypothetical protein [Arthrobacter sp. ISL-30]|uniref:hypothetical protein n=1 Tax=Arthrobacter sp. ISL-30 TaxID=2819109 RepID=UPI001BEA6896|nr:hypothetical protein [Arthrobacter sp. ISL-30]MBT2511972.1 hypothetical protein [Arthrobacter sp. ISL-30]